MKKFMSALMVWAIILSFGVNQTVLGCWHRPKDVTFSITNGVNDSQVELSINSKKFGPKVEVRLVKEGQPDIVAENVQVLSKTQVTCKLDLRGKAVGNWDVKIISTYRLLFIKINRSTLIEKAFTIEYPAPAISKIDPKEGASNTVLNATITGTGFRPGAAVILSYAQAEIGGFNVKVVSNTTISCQFKLNGLSPGLCNLKVVNDDGKAATLANSFTVTAETVSPPTSTTTGNPTNILQLNIQKITPDHGSNTAPVQVEITGSGFENGIAVKLVGNGLELPGAARIDSPEKLTCTFDTVGKAPGNYDLVATNPNGQSATLPGAFTIETGAPSDQLLKPIFFDFDKANIRNDQWAALDENVKLLLENRQKYVILGGNADERGTRPYNLKLSFRRADAVKRYLVQKGITADRIIIYSFGKDYPVRPGHDEESWAYNRRVDILFSETKLSEVQVLQLVQPK